MAANSPPSPTASQLPPIPASPTHSYASTANPPFSQFQLPLPPPPRPAHAVLTKADLEQSQAAYSDLLASAKAYRLALASLSTAASTFGAALESCARLKEARADALAPPAGAPLTNSFTAASAACCTAGPLLTVAGLQHLVANHQHILSETVYRAFEVPLLHDLDKWRAAVEDEDERYTRGVAAQSREIRRLEKEGLKLHRQRRRDVARFRGHLVELTAKLDGLTVLHGEHSRTLLREGQEASGRIVEASCSLARAEVDIFESLARKGWTGGGLEDVLEKGVDLFAAETDPLAGSGKGASVDGGAGFGAGEGATLFSILPPKSILADTSRADTLRPGKETRSDSLLVDTDGYRSLAGAISSDLARERDRDTDSVFSEPSRSRNVRPFSPQPQPLSLNPEDLLGGLESRIGGLLSGSGPGVEKGDGSKRDHDDGYIAEDDHQGGADDGETHTWRGEDLQRGTLLDSDDRDQDETGASQGDTPQRDESWGAPGSDS